MRVELEGVVLAESRPPVLVFETGLPARFYFDRSAVGCDDHVLVAFYDEPVDVVVDGGRQTGRAGTSSAERGAAAHRAEAAPSRAAR